MKNKKNILRIGTLLCFLMFLLIPLLSSPVAASFNRNIGGVWTNNTPGGPTAGDTIGGGNQFDNGPWNAVFTVSYNYRDTNPAPGGMGSNHWMDITVSWIPGNGGPAGGPNLYSQTPVTLAASGGPVTGTFSTTTITGYGGKNTVFTVTVVVTCQDIASTQAYSWSSTPATITII